MPEEELDESSKLPLVRGVEPIIGWRGWAFARPNFLVAREQVLEPRVAAEAHCLLGSHEAPQVDCTCGMYAFKLDQMMKERGYLHQDVLGEIKMWGRVIELERGWRAQYAYPQKLYFRNPAWFHLAEYTGYKYSVPVELMDKDHRLVYREPPPVVIKSKPSVNRYPMGSRSVTYAKGYLSNPLVWGLPPQARFIMNLFSKLWATHSQVSEKEFEEKLFEAMKDGSFKTAQHPLRVFKYYKPRLMSEGFLSEQRIRRL